MAVMRAIENGVSIVRVAAMGLSVVVDGAGDLGWDEALAPVSELRGKDPPQDRPNSVVHYPCIASTKAAARPLSHKQQPPFPGRWGAAVSWSG
jgi:hypothetical protein